MISIDEINKLKAENTELKEKIAKFDWEQPYYQLYCNVVAQRDELQQENARLKEENYTLKSGFDFQIRTNEKINKKYAKVLIQILSARDKRDCGRCLRE